MRIQKGSHTGLINYGFINYCETAVLTYQFEI